MIPSITQPSLRSGRRTAAALAGTALLAATALGQGTPGPANATALEPLVAFSGIPGGFGALEVYDARTGGLLSGPGRLRDVQLLGIDHTGRSEMESLLPGRPRLRTDLAGAATRLEVPFDRGSVYRYRRMTPNGLRFGFLAVPKSAFPFVLFERAAAAGLDPFEAKIGVAPDGSALLVATTLAAGGDLFELPLGGARPELRTAALAPLDWAADSLMLGRDWGFAITSNGPYRFQRRGGAEAVPVPTGGVTDWTGQVALSRARTFAVATAGADPAQRDAFVFGPTGAVVRASAAPARIEPAGFQPEYQGGPWMAVSDDGSHVAWVEFTPVGPTVLEDFRDVRLVEVASPGGTLVTSDPFLIDTLDEVGRMLFAQIGKLVYAAGEQNDPAEGGLESVDLFTARLAPSGTPIIENLTQTSGHTVPPFGPNAPALTPDRAYLVPGNRLLFHDDDAAAIRMVGLDTGLFQTLQTNVKEIGWVEPGAGAYFVPVRRDAQPRPWDLVRIDLAGAVSIQRQGTPSTEYLFPSRSGDWLAWSERVLTQDTLHRLHAPTATHQSWSTTPGALTAPLRVFDDGRVAFGFGSAATGVQSRVWRMGGFDVVLAHALRPGHLLP